MEILQACQPLRSDHSSSIFAARNVNNSVQAGNINAMMQRGVATAFQVIGATVRILGDRVDIDEWHSFCAEA